MASKENKNGSNFDKLPAPLQALVGIAVLALICLAGFGVFFAFDMLLLDFDPIGKLFSAIF